MIDPTGVDAQAVTPAGAPEGLGRPGLGVVAMLVLVSGSMLSMIDSAVVNVAIPDIASTLRSSLSQVQWTISGYLLGLAVGQSVVAWLDRRFGTLAVYRASLIAFALTSAACAAATDVNALIACRVLQGLAGAPLVPLALSLILGDGRSEEKMPLTAGLMFFAAPAFGPVLGGVLVSWFGWRSVFLINPPLALAGLLGLSAARFRALGTSGDRRARVDLAGVGLLAAGLGLVTFGVSRGPRDGWLTAGSAPYWAAGALLLALYLSWSSRMSLAGRPVALDLKLLRAPRRLASIGLVALTSVVLYSVLVLAPVFLQQVQGRSAIMTGLVLLPQGLVMGFAGGLGNVCIRLSVRRPWIAPASVTAGLVLLTVFTMGLVVVGDRTSPWVLALILCGRGLAIGLTTQPLVFGLLGGLPSAEQADANTLFTVSQRLAGSVGVALLTSYFAITVTASGSPVVALHRSALLLAALSAAGVVGGLWLLAASGRHDRGEKRSLART